MFNNISVDMVAIVLDGFIALGVVLGTYYGITKTMKLFKRMVGGSVSSGRSQSYVDHKQMNNYWRKYKGDGSDRKLTKRQSRDWL